jgi:hypothetical protein
VSAITTSTFWSSEAILHVSVSPHSNPIPSLCNGSHCHSVVSFLAVPPIPFCSFLKCRSPSMFYVAQVRYTQAAPQVSSPCYALIISSYRRPQLRLMQPCPPSLHTCVLCSPICTNASLWRTGAALSRIPHTRGPGTLVLPLTHHPSFPRQLCPVQRTIEAVYMHPQVVKNPTSAFRTSDTCFMAGRAGDALPALPPCPYSPACLPLGTASTRF